RRVTLDPAPSEAPYDHKANHGLRSTPLTDQRFLAGGQPRRSPQPFRFLFQCRQDCLELLVLDSIIAVKVRGEQKIVAGTAGFLGDVALPSGSPLLLKVKR